MAMAAAAEVAAAHGVATQGIGIDVTDFDGLDGAAAAAVDAIGPIGGLVHAAGTVSLVASTRTSDSAASDSAQRPTYAASSAAS